MYNDKEYMNIMRSHKAAEREKFRAYSSTHCTIVVIPACMELKIRKIKLRRHNNIVFIIFTSTQSTSGKHENIYAMINLNVSNNLLLL